MVTVANRGRETRQRWKQREIERVGECVTARAQIPFGNVRPSPPGTLFRNGGLFTDTRATPMLTTNIKNYDLWPRLVPDNNNNNGRRVKARSKSVMSEPTTLGDIF